MQDELLRLLPNLKRPSTRTDLIRVFIQPQKDTQNTYPDLPYTPQEISFWPKTIREIDDELTEVTRRNEGSFMEMVIPKSHARPVRRALNQGIQTIMKEPNISYISFAYGALPNMLNLFEMLPRRAQKRMQSTIIGGTEESQKTVTRVLTPIRPDFFDASLAVADDDVADTMAALAALTQTRRQHLFGKKYDADFIKDLNDTFTKPYEHSLNLYERLTREMKETGTIAAILVYKNHPFVKVLENTVNTALEYSPHNRWARMQKSVLEHRLDVLPSVWGMGLFMDTDVAGQKVYDGLSPEIRNDPTIEPFIRHLGTSRLRIGSTNENLLGLSRNLNAKPGDPLYKIAEMTTWVIGKIETSLKKYIKKKEKYRR